MLFGTRLESLESVDDSKSGIYHIIKEIYVAIFRTNHWKINLGMYMICFQVKVWRVRAIELGQNL